MFADDSVHKDSGGQAMATLSSIERCYQCRYCDFSATKPATIRGHVMSKHLNYRPYLCAFCDYRTITNALIRRHIKRTHPNLSDVEHNFSCLRDNVMDSRVNNGYYVYSHDKSAVLQDHTYNAVSFVAKSKTANDLPQNSDSIKPCNRSPVDNGAAKIIIVLKRKDLHTNSGNGNIHRCGQCEYSAVSRRALSIHMVKRHRKLELKCLYCDAVRLHSSEMFIHWHSRHQNLNLPFKYQQVYCKESTASATAAPADDEVTENEYLDTSSEFDNSFQGTDTSSEDVMSVSALTLETASVEPHSEVNDIIYCCETCPSSFCTPEALSAHECTSNTEQALD